MPERLLGDCAFLISALDTLQAGAALAGLDGTLIWANAAFARVAGCEPESLPGKPVWELDGEEAAQDLREFIARAGSSPTPLRKDFSGWGKTGQAQTTNYTITPVRNPGGAAAGFLVTLQQVSDAQRDTNRRQDVESNLFALIESSDEVIWSVDLDCRLLALNSALQQEAQKTIGTRLAVGMRPEDFLPAGKAAVWRSLYERALSEGSFRTEYPLIAGRGLELAFNPILRDGRKIGVSVFGKDITKRNAAEKRARETEVEYRKMFERAPDGFYRATPEGRVLLANRALAEMLGFESAQEFVAECTDTGTQVWLEPAQRSKFNTRLQELGTIHGFECRLKRKDGTPLWASLSSRIVHESGGRVHYYEGFVEDITERKQSEETSHLFESFWDQSRDILLIVRREDGRILGANQAAVGAYGYSKDELLALTIYKLRSHHSPRLIDEQMARADFEGLLFESEHVRKDGSIFPVEVSSKSATLGGAHVLISVVRNTTRKKAAQEALRVSEERYRSLIEQASDGVAISGEDARYSAVNSAFCDMTGYSRQELLGMRVWDLIAPEDQPRIACYRAELELSEGKPVLSEWRFVRKNGSILTFEANTRRLPNGDRLAIMRDISERKRVEAKLEQANLRIQLAVSAAGAGIWEWDIQSDTLSWDDRMFEFYGVSRDEFTSCYEAWRRALHPEDKAMAHEAIEASLRGERQFDVEFRIVLPDGTVRHIKSDAHVVRDANGRALRIVGLNRDITAATRATEEREQLQAQFNQAQRMESIGRLAGGVAHDFNNLLSVMNGYSRLMLNELQPGDQRWEYLSEINLAGEKAAALTKQLLAFSRKHVTVSELVDLNRLVLENQKFLKRLIGEDVELVLDCCPDPGPVMADPDQLHQVLLNLAVNARDAMPDGGRLSFRTTTADIEHKDTPEYPGAAPGSYMVLAVSDTGHGMDETVRRRLFEPFFTTKGLGKGTGLGLSTVYGIVHQCGGWIKVESEPGRGATFSIGLPLKTGAEEASRELAPLQRGGFRGFETLLVVEDQDEVRRFAVSVLQSYGYTVVEATDGNEALRLLDSHDGQIDLVLSDVVMPGLGGKELALRLSRRSPRMPVLLMSGYLGDESDEGVLPNDGLRYLHKPFTPEELARRVREMLGPLAPQADVSGADDQTPIGGASELNRTQEEPCATVAHLPGDLRASLLAAVLDGDSAQLDILIAKAATHDPAAAAYLHRLGLEYEYDTLSNALRSGTSA